MDEPILKGATATYSPEDNKLRLYPTHRLDSEVYSRVKAAGFSWAPKQELFVAPMWTPEREDLLLELCGEIDDEDTSLVERAEQRADRFEDYGDRRRADAEAAREIVSRIADGIPLGQPILIGHHSERHARKDAERIESGMRRAVKMWRQSEYWQRRAEGAIRAAKYKERPDVRHRRIKGLESDKRSHERDIAQAQQRTRLWQSWRDTPGHDPELALKIANASCTYGAWSDIRDGKRTPLEVCDGTIADCERIIARAERWIEHITNRIAYERAMLEESGGTAHEQWNIEPGGRVLVGGEWLAVLRVNRSNGAVNSVSTTPPSGVTWTNKWKYGIEKVKGYRPPEQTEKAKAEAATKLPPLCNYRSAGCEEMTSEEWKRATRASDFNCVVTVKATETTGTHRRRYRCRLSGNDIPVFIADAPVKQPPKPEQVPEPPTFERQVERSRPKAPAPQPQSEAAEFLAMAESLRSGEAVQVVSTPQLFPTPPDLARRMADEAGILAGLRVLEPSAGTGSLIRAIHQNATGADCVRVVAVEINPSLAEKLRLRRGLTLHANESNFEVRCADFLECDGELGVFDRILMNPPFENGSDIKHILHAMSKLKPGGRLVAICANGPRQQEKLRPLAKKWEPLPEGTFAGTGVRAALLVMEASQ